MHVKHVQGMLLEMLEYQHIRCVFIRKCYIITIRRNSEYPKGICCFLIITSSADIIAKWEKTISSFYFNAVFKSEKDSISK